MNTVAVLSPLRKRMVTQAVFWQDPLMRQAWLWVVGLAAVVSGAACDGKSADGSDEPSDIMVLEVGGTQPSLRAALIAQGVTVTPGYQLSQPSEGGVADLERVDGRQQHTVNGSDQGVGGLGSAEKSSQEPVAIPDPALPQESEWVVVTLRENETLTHVARRCLGNGHRFYEIMKWNGFSDRDTRRMAVGTAIKIKRSEMR